jgi:transcriptional regulator with XRE-family HTH domain
MICHHADMNRLPDNLRFLLTESGISENDLAEQTGVPQPTINRILRGLSRDPRDGTLRPLAEFFGVTVEELRTSNIRATRDPSRKDQRPSDLVTNQLENDIDALRYALIGLVAVMADERPAEGGRVAEAIRKAVPERFLMRGFLHGLLKTLDRGAASATAPRAGRRRAKTEP